MGLSYGRIDYTVEPYSSWDLASYRDMAQAAPQLDVGTPSPFAYRLLGPYLAGLLPVPDPIAFYGLTLGTSVLLVILLYGTLREFGIDVRTSVGTTVLFTFNRYLFGLHVWDYFQVNDVIGLACIAATFRGMYANRWWVVCVFMLISVVAREAPLIMVPTIVVFLLERGRFYRCWKRVLWALTPSLIAFALLRTAIPVGGGQGLLEAFLAHSGKLASPETWFRLLVNPFLPLSFLPLVFFQTTVFFFREQKHALLFVALVLGSTLFGSNNERLMAPASIVFYLLLARVLSTQGANNRASMTFLIAASFLASLHHVRGVWPLPSRDATLLLSAVSLAAVTLAALIFRFKPGIAGQALPAR